MKNLKKRLTAMASLCAFCLSMAGVPAAAEGTSLLGDSDMDGTVTAKDASIVLMFAATMGLSDAETIGEELGMDITVSDVNADGAIDAKDAGNILEYTSAVGTGFVGTMEIFMMEPTAKNFEYYLALSDYEVYKEYCEVYGFEAEETLPEEEDLPQQGAYFNHTTESVGEGNNEISYWFWCQENVARSIEEQGYFLYRPELLGFPEYWKIVDFSVSSSSPTEVDEKPYVQVELRIYFRFLSDIELDYVPYSYETDTIDMYRIRLTLQHSVLYTQYGLQGEGMDPGIYLGG